MKPVAYKRAANGGLQKHVSELKNVAPKMFYEFFSEKVITWLNFKKS